MKYWLLVMLAGQAFDLGTTAAKMRQGCVEANPLLSSPIAISAVKGGAVVTLSLTLPRAHRQHPTVAKWIAGSVAASGFAAGAYNLSVRSVP